MFGSPRCYVYFVENETLCVYTLGAWIIPLLITIYRSKEISQNQSSKIDILYFFTAWLFHHCSCLFI